jgi:acyl carrier protein
MERSVIVDALRKSIHVCVGLDDIDVSKTMQDYAISSLDNVEIVSMTTRTLRVKVPRAQLLKAANINELIDVIYAAASDAPVPA